MMSPPKQGTVLQQTFVPPLEQKDEDVHLFRGLTSTQQKRVTVNSSSSSPKRNAYTSGGQGFFQPTEKGKYCQCNKGTRETFYKANTSKQKTHTGGNATSRPASSEHSMMSEKMPSRFQATSPINKSKRLSIQNEDLAHVTEEAQIFDAKICPYCMLEKSP